MITDSELYAISETAMRQLWEQQDRQERESALELVDKLNRRSLLIALDWHSPGIKTNTERLRSKVKALVQDGAINTNDLYHARNCGE